MGDELEVGINPRKSRDVAECRGGTVGSWLDGEGESFGSAEAGGVSPTKACWW